MGFRTSVRACAALAVLGASFANAIPGQPGTLDASWATLSPLGAGKVITPVLGSDSAKAIALQPDGKVLLAGTCSDGIAVQGFCALRYNANGTLDASFGNAGAVVTPEAQYGTANATAMVLQPDGKVVLAGRCFNGSNYDFCALRYGANGALDTLFGSGGVAISAIGSGDDVAVAMALQPDGKIVLVGYCMQGGNYNVCALRYSPSGTLDTSFGTGGKTITPGDIGSVRVAAMTLQPDGKIVLAGSCYNGTNEDFCATRYNTNGALDTAFGSGGTVVTPISSNNEFAVAIAMQPDDKIVLAGYCSDASNNDFCALRYKANGTLDTSFGSGGSAITPVGSSFDILAAVAVQPDGKILLAGSCDSSAITVFCILRYHTNGVPDTSFGTGGIVMTPVSGLSDSNNAIALQSDGKILLAGTCSSGPSLNFCATRYDGGAFGFQNCKPDIDGDGSFLATTDALIYARIALGITGNAVINGITFPATATRNTWPLIRDYLVKQCGMSLVQ